MAKKNEPSAEVKPRVRNLNYRLLLKDGAEASIEAPSESDAVAKAQSFKDAKALKDCYDGRTVWEAAP